MVNKYLVVSNGLSKKTGKEYSVVFCIFVSNDNPKYSFVSSTKKFVDGFYPIGRILEIEISQSIK